MKRIIVLAAVVGAGVLSLGIVAAQDAMVIEVEQLEDNLYVLRGAGGGGNTAVFVTSDGVVVVDSKNPGWGQSILDAIGELTSNPVTTLVNTHSHHDHVSGNVAFPANVDIVTHEVTAANMQVMRAYSGRTEPPANVFADSMGRGLPTQTFSERMSIGTGDDRVDLYHFGRGHTGGDAWIVFPVHGDAAFRRHLPGQEPALPRRQQRGSGVDIADSLQKAHDNIQGVDTIITGHSTQMTWADLHEYAAFNRDFLAAVRAGHAAGQSVDEIVAGWTMPDGYEGYRAPAPAGLTNSVHVIVDELEGN